MLILRIVLSPKVVSMGAPIWLLLEPDMVIGRPSLLQTAGQGFPKVICFHNGFFNTIDGLLGVCPECIPDKHLLS